MGDPYYLPLSSTLTSISVQWDALTSAQDTGNGLINSYHLEWDGGTGSWADVQG